MNSKPVTSFSFFQVAFSFYSTKQASFLSEKLKRYFMIFSISYCRIQTSLIEHQTDLKLSFE